MVNISRRAALLGTAAAAVAPAISSLPARAAAPAKGNQVAGFYRYKVGDIEVTVVSDGVNRFKLPDDMVANVPKDQVQAALSAAHVEAGMFYNPYNPVIVNTGSKLVLIDTGTGEASHTQSKGQIGQFLTNAKAAGYEPKDFDAVVISHYHGDHVNGLLKADNTITFPNAEILV